MVRVLLIDDDDLVRDTLRRGLEDHGLDVLEAGDGLQGLERLVQGGVDVVVTDILMPGMEGIEFITRARAVDPHARIVAISGGGWHVRAGTVLATAELVGADRLLQKPFTPSALVETVGELLGGGRGPLNGSS